MLRDFGRRLCSAEWARLTGRTKCAEIIDNYMEKMQLNPGLSYRPPGVASSEPSLLNKRPSSLSLISTGKSKDSWVQTLTFTHLNAISDAQSISHIATRWLHNPRYHCNV